MSNIFEKRNTPFDYTENRIWVYFEVADKDYLKKYLISQHYINTSIITEETNGFNIFICNQHIPDIIRDLIAKNIAIYQVVRLDKDS